MKDFRFEIETKATPYDFSSFLPDNPFLKREPGTTLGVECDGIGEFLAPGGFAAVSFRSDVI